MTITESVFERETNIAQQRVEKHELPLFFKELEWQGKVERSGTNKNIYAEQVLSMEIPVFLSASRPNSPIVTLISYPKTYMGNVLGKPSEFDGIVIARSMTNTPVIVEKKSLGK